MLFLCQLGIEEVLFLYLLEFTTTSLTVSFRGST